MGKTTGCGGICEAVRGVGHLVEDGDGAQAMEEEQERGVDVAEQVLGLEALGAQREQDLCGPAVAR